MSGDRFPSLPALVPHSGDMVFLDSVVRADATDLTARLCITERSMFFDGAGVGAWVGIEYMAQAIAAHAGWLALQRGEPISVGFLLGSRRYQCQVPHFALGTTLDVHIHHALQGENGLAAFECHIDEYHGDQYQGDQWDASRRSGGARLATATVTVYQPDNVHEFLQRST